MALHALGKNKIQTALTMLGIVIGVSAVIAMVSLGQGASKLVQDQVAGMTFCKSRAEVIGSREAAHVGLQIRTRC
jgi:ABC-type lipoprotein release transport system permease subunit